ncbi:MAG: HAMP domain-containing protein [Leptolyngbya sp. DLM2.Bin15]|nr:MAG: HAMP domain-containing protein [Leptolyngbya sp. DLM2.Bin15]
MDLKSQGMQERSQDVQETENPLSVQPSSTSSALILSSNRARFPQRLLQIRNWRIYQKIGIGYFWSIGIGLTGSLLGLVVADYYQGQAITQLLDAQTQSLLLGQLETAGREAQFQSLALDLAVHTDKPYQPHWVQFQLAMDQARTRQLALTSFLDNNPSWFAAPPEVMTDILNDYLQALQIYEADLASALQALTEARSQPEQAAAQANLTNLVSGTSAAQINEIHAQIIQLTQTAQQQELEGTVEMEDAQGLEKLIIVWSMIVSAAVAGGLAFRTTRAIAQPLEQVTHIAQRVAAEADFTLRAPITNHDEIGWLAQSLNNLIQRIQEYTHDLKQAAQTTEAQNKELQKALGNLRQAQAQLIQTEKMSSLGQLVAGVAHEINNPVSFIYGNISHVKQYTNDLLTLLSAYQAELPQPSSNLQKQISTIDLDFLQADLPKVLQSLQVGAERINSIVLSLRLFSRLHESEKKPFDLHQGLDSTLLILNSRLKAQPNREAIAVIKHYGDIPFIECYGGQINQVFMNILSNAIDALEERIVLESPQASTMSQNESREACDRSSDPPSIHIQTHSLADHDVLVTIADNGAGIPDSIASKLFDPFFTTKPIGKGTGLGLAISYQIITEQHQGTLTCKSVLGQGTVFTIKIPVIGRVS